MKRIEKALHTVWFSFCWFGRCFAFGFVISTCVLMQYDQYTINFWSKWKSKKKLYEKKRKKCIEEEGNRCEEKFSVNRELSVAWQCNAMHKYECFFLYFLHQLHFALLNYFNRCTDKKNELDRAKSK